MDTSHATQHELIQTIVNKVGEPYEVEEVTPEQAMLVENADLLTVDLRMVPTPLMTASDFSWHSKGGLAENIDEVAMEFCKWRNLRQVKILVSGETVQSLLLHSLPPCRLPFVRSFACDFPLQWN